MMWCDSNDQGYNIIVVRHQLFHFSRHFIGFILVSHTSAINSMISHDTPSFTVKQSLNIKCPVFSDVHEVNKNTKIKRYYSLPVFLHWHQKLAIGSALSRWKHYFQLGLCSCNEVYVCAVTEYLKEANGHFQFRCWKICS